MNEQLSLEELLDLKIKLLELIETRKIGLIREEQIRQKEEIKKNKEKEQKDE